MEYKNSCLMLQVSLWTGIDLSAVFKEEDLKDSGIELDSHITIFYSDKIVPKEGLLNNIKTILGEDNNFLESFKDPTKFKVLDYFELEKFENDSDYLVLKLQSDNELYNNLGILNTGLMSKYDLTSDFKNYTPHVTLAELQPGKAKNYMFSKTLGLILESALFSIDDLVLSYGVGDNEYKHFQITSENAVTRYFRQRELERDKKYYESL